MIFIADIENKTWFYEEDTSFSSSELEVGFGFRKNGKLPVQFNNLIFGYKITNNDLIISEGSMPPDAISYISTDQEIIHVFEINNKIKPGKEYFITVWAENNEERLEHILLFSFPIPQKPYDSWIWDEENSLWNPPISYPEDNDNYIWNEETISWDKI